MFKTMNIHFKVAMVADKLTFTVVIIVPVKTFTPITKYVLINHMVLKVVMVTD